MTSEQTLYSLLVSKYVPVIGGFIRGLCRGAVERWAEAVSMETEGYSEGVLSFVLVQWTYQTSDICICTMSYISTSECRHCGASLSKLQ